MQAFDPYRLGLRDELSAVRRKLDSGADGFFTQPMFDVRLLEMCAELLAGQEVFWGIAPVIGERSRAYWEATNKVIFPTAFAPTLSWNRSFAADAVDAVRRLAGNVYFMPIRVSLTAYFSNLLPD
jgi:methylenetetrahydrofolate reductase (NADPH)